MKKLSWEEVEETGEELSKKIETSGFVPDCIIGITTGGFIPLFFLAKYFEPKDILTVSVKSKGEGRKKQTEIHSVPRIPDTCRRVLLVDEIAESGVTLHSVKGAIRKQHATCEIKTAALAVNKDREMFPPDFYILVEKGDWIVFPWEKEMFPEYKKYVKQNT